MDGVSENILSRAIVDKEGRLTPNILKLLELVTPSTLKISPELDLQAIVDATQKEWLRQPNQERWNIQDKIDQNRDEILTTLDALLLFKQLSPSQQHYDYCLLFGSTVSNMRKRFAYILELWNKGIRFDSLIFLGGERILDPEKEPVSLLFDCNNHDLPCKKDWVQPKDMPRTEFDAMEIIVDQAELPEGFDNINIVFINAPAKKKADGSYARPTTQNTIDAWLATDPKPGSCLFVSHQPYVGYQDTVARTYMSSNFTIETVGNSGSENNVSVLLDNVARWLYQENARRNQAHIH